MNMAARAILEAAYENGLRHHPILKIGSWQSSETSSHMLQICRQAKTFLRIWCEVRSS
jgi:hypothetical protein